MKKIIFLDFDDTLYYTSRAKKNALEECFSEKNIDAEIAKKTIFILQKTRKFDLLLEHPLNLINVILQINGLAKPRDIDAIYTKYTAKIKRDILPNAHLFGCLRYIKSQDPDTKFVILTNNYLQTTIGILKEKNELDFFDGIITPEFFGESKTEFFFQAVLQLYQIKPHECVMIGDNDLTDGSCKHLGIKYCNIQVIGNMSDEEIYEEFI